MHLSISTCVDISTTYFTFLLKKIKFALEEAKRGEQRYSSTLSLTSALGGIGG
jgi:hypothetical protein